MNVPNSIGFETTHRKCIFPARWQFTSDDRLQLSRFLRVLLLIFSKFSIPFCFKICTQRSVTTPVPEKSLILLINNTYHVERLDMKRRELIILTSGRPLAHGKVHMAIQGCSQQPQLLLHQGHFHAHCMNWLCLEIQNQWLLSPEKMVKLNQSDGR